MTTQDERLARGVDRAIDEVNREAMNPETVECLDCGATVEPTRLTGVFFDPPGTTLRHHCPESDQPSGWRGAQSPPIRPVEGERVYLLVAVPRYDPHVETVERIRALLPQNYSVVHVALTDVLVVGVDSAGWTADDYVIPRLASGLLIARRLVDPAR